MCDGGKVGRRVVAWNRNRRMMEKEEGRISVAKRWVIHKAKEVTQDGRHGDVGMERKNISHLTLKISEKYLISQSLYDNNNKKDTELDAMIPKIRVLILLRLFFFFFSCSKM